MIVNAHEHIESPEEFLTYRKIMEKMMNAGGLEYFATDDPEISSHPANCLMAKIGSRIDTESIQRFDQLRFMNRFMY